MLGSFCVQQVVVSFNTGCLFVILSPDLEIKKKEEYTKQGSFRHLDSLLGNRQLKQFAGKSLVNKSKTTNKKQVELTNKHIRI